MPRIFSEPIFGIHNNVTATVITEDDYILKNSSRLIMNSLNRKSSINYEFEPIQSVNPETNNIQVSGMPFSFIVAIEFIEDEENENKMQIAFNSSQNDDETVININMLNFDLDNAGTLPVDITTMKKMILDCGNGVGVFIEIHVCCNPGSSSYCIEINLYSKIVDEDLAYGDTDTEETEE